MNFLLVACGGFIGSILRYFISLKLSRRFLGTFIVNITGSIFLAITFLCYGENLISHSLWLFLGIGFCGAYTTFSTFGHEALTLFLEKKYAIMVVYVAGSLTISLFFVGIILHFYSFHPL